MVSHGFFKMNGKKGISAIVATVLIVMITVTAVAIISGFLIPFVKNQLDETECVKYKEYYSFDDSFGLICANKTSHGISIASKSDKELGEKIIGFNLQFIKIGESKIQNVRVGDVKNGIRMLDSSENLLSIPINGDIETFVFEGNDFKSVRIYPVIKKNSGERVCQFSDEIIFKTCALGGAELNG